MLNFVAELVEYKINRVIIEERIKMAALFTTLAVLVSFACHLQPSQGSSQDEINTMLMAKIEALEKQGEAQQDRITQLEGGLRSQDAHIHHQDSERVTLQEHVHTQDKIIQQLLTGDHQANIAANVQGLLNGNSRQSRLMLDHSESVAFLATISKSNFTHIAVNQTVIFDTATVNLGGGYSTATGQFTVPRTGIYLLSTSFVSVASHQTHEIHLSLRNNGQELTKVMAHGDSGHLDQGSTVVVTPLNAGAVVTLANIGDPDNTLGGNGYSNFCGVLLYEM